MYLAAFPVQKLHELGVVLQIKDLQGERLQWYHKKLFHLTATRRVERAGDNLAKQL